MTTLAPDLTAYRILKVLRRPGPSTWGEIVTVDDAQLLADFVDRQGQCRLVTIRKRARPRSVVSRP